MFPSVTWRRLFLFTALLVLAGYILLDPLLAGSSPNASSIDVDVVLSSYREDSALVARQIEFLRNSLDRKRLSSRITVYLKDPSLSSDAAETLGRRIGADRVHRLGNLGREGGTFLTHIVSNYDRAATAPGRTATHVLFAQSILEYPELVPDRLAMFRKDTRFLSLGSYRACGCGRDRDLAFPRMREIYSMFNGELCAGKGQLCTYKGQFVVSWRQILSNPKSRYQHLLDVLEAPQSHWIYNDPEDRAWEYKGQKSTPNGPFFGHALERSWPTIFGCTDVSIAERCTPVTPSDCQCLHGDA